MTVRDKRPGVMFRLRHPKTTVRWRLTLLYGGLFLVCGAGLLAVTYTLVAHATVSNAPFRQFVSRTGPSPGGLTPPNATFRSAAPANSYQGGGSGAGVVAPSPAFPPAIKQLLRSRTGRIAIQAVGSDQRISDLHQLVIESGIALAIMALICAALGWVVAGRVLAPLRTMTAATQQISEINLHQRLALRGPQDELRQLADTIDGLLGRLEGAFDAQRRFVANASHELRTPLTAARAMLEMIISDPDATVETFRTTCREVLEEGDRQEQLIDALLALAQGQRGIDGPERVDLAAIVGEVLRTHGADAGARGLELDVSLEPAQLSGDHRLVERLVSNLVENALRHNVPDGSVRVTVKPRGGGATLVIANTGPIVPEGEIDRLLQPFQRLATDRVGHGNGLGLGLSIVAAIADAHGARLDIRPGRDGGLDVVVRFPPVEGKAADDRDGGSIAAEPLTDVEPLVRS